MPYENHHVLTVLLYFLYNTPYLGKDNNQCSSELCLIYILSFLRTHIF